MTLHVVRPTSSDVPIPSVDKFQGCLLGCAVGDAAGAWAERKPASVAAAYAEALQSFDFSMATEHHGGMVFGQYTDDTQLTRELALSLLEQRGFVPDAFAKKVGSLFANHLIVGGGRATAGAAKRINEGVPWDQAGAPAPLAGNGAAMRAAPVGLFYWSDLNGLLQAARDQAYVTHQAEESVAGAVAVSTAVAMCLNASKATSNPRELGWWQWLVRFIAPYGAEFAGELSSLVEQVFFLRRQRASFEEERALARSLVGANDDPSWEGVSPWARSSVLWSLYCLCAHPTDYWAAVTLAIWPGGDVDTTAAMAGAMVGAHVGIKKFPRKVIETFETRLVDVRSPFWDWDSLVLLATRLHEVATTDAQPTD